MIDFTWRDVHHNLLVFQNRETAVTFGVERRTLLWMACYIKKFSGIYSMIALDIINSVFILLILNNKLDGLHKILEAYWLSEVCYNLYYYSFKIFSWLWLAKSTRLIHHNQLLITKFGRILRLTRKWRQKCSVLAG